MKLLISSLVRYDRFKLILLFSLINFFPDTALTQSESREEIVFKKEKKDQQLSTVKKRKKKDKVPYFFRHHKKIPITYTGYAIELTTADLPLKRDYFLFEKFGNVHYEKREGGGYAYLILIQFKTKKSVENFLNNIVLPKAPEAKMVLYKRGVRKTK